MRKKKTQPVAAADLRSAWDAAFAQYQLDDIDAVHAEGWKTCDEVASERGMPQKTVQGILMRSVSAGRMERKQFRVQLPDRVLPLWFYRPTQA